MGAYSQRDAHNQECLLVSYEGAYWPQKFEMDKNMEMKILVEGNILLVVGVPEANSNLGSTPKVRNTWFLTVQYV